MLAAGQANAAEVTLRRLLVQAPSDAQAQNNLGIALDMQNRHVEAQTAYKAALKIMPDMVAAQVNLGHSYALAGDNAQALAVLQPLAAQPLATKGVRRDLAAALSLAGDKAGANDVLRAAFDQQSNNGAALQAAR
jgi:Flp pilus assembly protein TadD